MIRRLINAIKNRKRKKRSRLYRYTNGILLTMCVAYLFLLFFPNLLFAHSARVGQFNFHSDRPIPSEIKTVAEQANLKLSSSPFYKTTESFDIFIAEDKWRRVLLSARSSGAFGSRNIITGNILLNRCDIKNNLCINDQPKFNRRTMHSVLAHESMHQLLADELGLLAYFRLPTWKNEGYCEYIAGDPSFGEDRGEKLLRDGKSNNSHSFRYLTYLFAVRSCLDNEGLEPRQLMSQSIEFQTSLDSYIDELRGE